MAHQSLLKLGSVIHKYSFADSLSRAIIKGCNKRTMTGGKKCTQRQEKRVEKKIPPESKVAVILSGCGVLDGTEIHEAAAVAVHLNKNSLHPVFYAPECPQKDVVNHKTGCPVDEVRNVLVESARIARGKIKCLNNLTACDVGAVVFPGGFGVGKTLCTYDEDQENFAYHPEVLRILTEFNEAQKPMGFMCISPVLAARLFPCVKITLGMKGDTRKWPYEEAITHAESMGASVELRPVSDFSFDKQYLVFSTPAFMYNGGFDEIFEGIGIMINMMAKIMK